MVCMYNVYEQEKRLSAHDEYVTHSDFPATVATALKKGFRHASFQEINASANSHWGAIDLHCFKGGLWVKINVNL